MWFESSRVRVRVRVRAGVRRETFDMSNSGIELGDSVFDCEKVMPDQLYLSAKRG